MPNFFVGHNYDGEHGVAEFFLETGKPFLIVHDIGLEVSSMLARAMNELINHVQRESANEIIEVMRRTVNNLNQAGGADLGVTHTVITQCNLDYNSATEIVTVPKGTKYTPSLHLAYSRLGKESSPIREFEQDVEMEVEAAFDNRCYGTFAGEEITIYKSFEILRKKHV
jgi:hypothetical protein